MYSNICIVKISGKEINNIDKLKSFIKSLLLQGKKIIIVHGAGKQIDFELKAKSLEAKYYNGIRFTDNNVIKVVSYVTLGIIQPMLLARLLVMKFKAISISGIDIGKVGGIDYQGDLNYGKVYFPSIKDINVAIINSLFNIYDILLYSSIMFNNKGEFFNVNADYGATILAGSLKAESLFFCTDVDGILDKDKVLIKKLSINSDFNNLIKDNTITAGMIAKLKAISEIIDDVKEVKIIGSRFMINQNLNQGTLIVS